MPSVGIPSVEDARVEVGGAVRVDGGGPAGEDERRRVASRDVRGGQPVADELRVDACLAYTTGDELAVLAAEIDDEHRTLLGCRLGGRERNDLRHQRR